MSVTFCSDIRPEYTTRDFPCQCEGKYADCYDCHGTGIETVRETKEEYPNFCNENAAAILRSTGFYTEELFGEAPIAEFRRGLLRALNSGRLESRETEAFQGKAKAINGEIHRGPRVVSFGLSEDDLRYRLERLLAFVMREQAKGATIVTWG